MTPLFDLDAYAPRPDAPVEVAQNRREGETEIEQERSATVAPISTAYWVRGIFRFENGKGHTRTVQAVSTNTPLETDVQEFVATLAEEGWRFPEGRAALIELLGVGTDDGKRITLHRQEE